MPKFSKMFPSRYLSAADIETDTTVTIKSIRMETVGRGDDEETKPVIKFEELEKPFVCNKTNALTLVTFFGDDTDDWEGQEITLYSTTVNFGSDEVQAIRIRKKRPAAKKPAPAPAGAKPGTRTSADVGPADDFDEFPEAEGAKKSPF